MLGLKLDYTADSDTGPMLSTKGEPIGRKSTIYVTNGYEAEDSTIREQCIGNS